MAYDEALADRIRQLLGLDPDVSEKEMFGGLAFLVAGNMALAASGGGGLLLRVEREDTDAVLARRHAEPFVMRGRELTGWVRVTEGGVETDEQLREWVEIGVDTARSQPPK